MHEHLHVGGARKLRDARVKLRAHHNGSAEFRIGFEDQTTGRGVGPVRIVFKTQNNVVTLLHLASNQILHQARRLLKTGKLATRRGGNQTRGIDDGQVRAILVLDLNHNILRPKSIFGLQSSVLAFNVRLEFGQGELLFAAERVILDQKAPGLHRGGIVLHIDRNRTTSLGATTNVVELEPHESLDKRRLTIGLMPADENRRSVKRLVKLLRHRVQLRVRLVQSLVRLVEEAVR
mmetsp:Transcript_6022/g.21741  ORF Transcript_6022/g.21741 Transcript_6022/m.21741 type:complete len:234 (+) Transcript_6022:1867-2568(+)